MNCNEVQNSRLDKTSMGKVNRGGERKKNRGWLTPFSLSLALSLHPFNIPPPFHSSTTLQGGQWRYGDHDEKRK